MEKGRILLHLKSLGTEQGDQGGAEAREECCPCDDSKGAADPLKPKLFHLDQSWSNH